MGIGKNLDINVVGSSDSNHNSNSRGPGAGNANWTLISDFTMGMYTGIDVGLDSKPEFGDLDNDVDMDLIVGQSDGTLNYFQNTGSANQAAWAASVKLQSGGNNINLGGPCVPELVDLDDDGDLDLVIGEGWGEMSFYNNTGNVNNPIWTYWGKLNQSKVAIDKGGFCAPSLADLDGDGDFDLTIGDWLGSLFYFENTGSATYPTWKENNTMYNNINLLPNSVYVVPELGDLDDDGDFDLLVGEDHGLMFYFENIGDPSEPNWSKEAEMFTDVNVTTWAAPALADLDNDGDLDLTLGEKNGTLALYDNDMIFIDRIRLFFRMENGDGPKKKTCYAKYKPYSFKVTARSSFGLGDIKSVKMILDNEGERLEYLWTNASQNFTEVRDPNDYAEIVSTSMNGTNDSVRMWTFRFKIIFNWTYPDENNHTVRIFCDGYSPLSAWYNRSNAYRVENDLVLRGDLAVEGEKQGNLSSGDRVRKGENITWSGVKVVYENTTNIYPLDSEFNVTISDDDGDKWINSSSSGKNISIRTTADLDSDNTDTHRINITDVPPACVNNSMKFTLKVDCDNVTFSDPSPDEDAWQTSLDPECSIRVMDVGGSEVNASSIDYSFSTDEGNTWSDWTNAGETVDNSSIESSGTPTFLEGRGNLIKWRAMDTVGNEYNQSGNNKIIIDISNVTFEDPSPNATVVLNETNIEVGITVLDELSGVDAASIEYMISTDNRSTWSAWIAAPGTNDSTIINVTVSRIFVNGTGNYIKWRASDVAGNGPWESDEYQIKIDTSIPEIPNTAPEVSLVSPGDNDIIASEKPVLSWNCTDPDVDVIYYNVYLGTNESKVLGKAPSVLVSNSQQNTNFFPAAPLSDDTTYYWTVIPNDGTVDGLCISGVWTFRIVLPEVIPAITLQKPLDHDVINEENVKLEWNVTYNGTDVITYDVYLDKVVNPSILISENLSSNSLSVEDLDDDTTYYWKVAVNVGDEKTAVVSEIHSFKIDLSFVPIYGVNLTLEKNEISMEQGETVNLSITVANLGNTIDEFILSLVPGPLGEDVILENEGDLILIGANKSFLGKITLRVGTHQAAGDYTVKISVKSSGDISGNTMVERTLVVKVINTSGDDDTDDDVDDDTDDDIEDDTDDDTEIDDTDGRDTTGEKSFLEGSFFIILMVGLFILIVVIVLMIIMRRKKKDISDDETTELQKTETPHEELPVMVVKEPITEDTHRELGGIEEETNQIPGGVVAEYPIDESTAPECTKCGRRSDYYEEYDCYWCENCQEYVDENVTTGDEIEFEDTLVKEENITTEEEPSTDKVIDESELLDTDADKSEPGGNSAGNEMNDEKKNMEADVDASETETKEKSSENEVNDETEIIEIDNEASAAEMNEKSSENEMDDITEVNEAEDGTDEACITGESASEEE